MLTQKSLVYIALRNDKKREDDKAAEVEGRNSLGSVKY